MQNQALLDKIDALREKNSQQAVVINNAQQTAAFGQMIGQATSPIVAAVNALQSDVNGIKCKLPETVTLPYSCATAVPTLEIGKVTNVSVPVPKYGNPGMYNQEMIVDITAD